MNLPNFDEMTPGEVCEWGRELARRAGECGEIKATLIVNCKAGLALANLGIEYDESHSVLWNLCGILETLRNQVNDLRKKYARLIAAPDLLEACKAIEWCGRLTGSWIAKRYCPSCGWGQHVGHDADCKLAAAIAKAEGKEV